MNVPVSRLGSEAAELLDRVRAGEDVVLTDAGVPVARLSPVQQSETVAERIARLEREGAISPQNDPGASKPVASTMQPIEVTPGPPISDLVTEMRRR